MNKPLFLALAITIGLIGLSDFFSILPSITLRSYGFTLGFIGLIALLIWQFGYRMTVLGVLCLSILTTLDAITQIGHMRRPEAWLLSPNYLGGFALLAIFLTFLVQSPRWFMALSIGANLVSLVLSQSRGAAMGLILGSLYLARGRWRWLWTALPIAIIATIAWHGGIGASERWYNWFSGLHDFTMKPLLGWGQNSPHTSYYTRFYNILIDWLVSSGIAGTASAIVCLCLIWKKGDTFLRAFLVAYLTNGMFIYDSPGTNLMLMLAVASVCYGDKSHLAGFIDDDQTFVGVTAIRSSGKRLGT